MESQVIVWCGGKEGVCKAWGRRFESQMMQMCIFRKKMVPGHNRSYGGGWLLGFFLFSVHGFVGRSMSLITWIFLNFFLFSAHGIVRAGHVKIIFSGRCITRPKNSIFSSQNLGWVRSPLLKICFYPPLQTSVLRPRTASASTREKKAPLDLLLPS